MIICDGCGASNKDETVVKVYGYDLCEGCNGKVLDFVLRLVKKEEGG